MLKILGESFELVSVLFCEIHKEESILLLSEWVMGHGVSTPRQNHTFLYEKRFAEIEKKCQSGYFYSALEEYRTALQSAIRGEALDFLEILLIGGPAKKCYPVHMAAMSGKLVHPLLSLSCAAGGTDCVWCVFLSPDCCSYVLGKVECLDLLLEAGYPGNSKDPNGNTPLHYTILSTEDLQTAALCASLLSLKYPSLWKVYDDQGFAAIHLAAKLDRIAIFQVLLQPGEIDLNYRTRSGKTLEAICTECHANQVLKLITNPQNLNDSRSKNEYKAGKRYVPQPPSLSSSKQVDMDRIMQVWDKFFENAFRMAESRLEMDALPPSPSFKESSSSSSKKSKRAKERKGWSEEMEYKTSLVDDESNYHNYNSSRFENADETEFQDDTYMECSSWFDYCLYFDEEQSEYLILHNTLNTVRYSLVEFLAFYEYSSLVDYRFFQDTTETLSSYALPTNLYDCVALGWITYFDPHRNVCFWKQLYTESSEYYLPLGEDVEQWGHYSSVETMAWLQLHRFESSAWYGVSKSCCKSWVMVVCNGENEQDAMYYYFNTLTRTSSWYPPGYDEEYNPDGNDLWQELLSEWNGWYLCCMEDSLDQLFWYDPTSGESSWVV